MLPQEAEPCKRPDGAGAKPFPVRYKKYKRVASQRNVNIDAKGNQGTYKKRQGEKEGAVDLAR